MDKTGATRLGVIRNLPSKRDLVARIDQMNVSADAKAILRDIMEVSVELGGKLIAAGRRIIDFILDLVHQFPNTAFGLLAALVVAMLVASVPFLGSVLSPFLTPLLLAFGLAKGALTDAANGAVAARVRKLEAEFNALGSKA